MFKKGDIAIIAEDLTCMVNWKKYYKGEKVEIMELMNTDLVKIKYLKDGIISTTSPSYLRKMKRKNSNIKFVRC